MEPPQQDGPYLGGRCEPLDLPIPISVSVVRGRNPVGWPREAAVLALKFVAHAIQFVHESALRTGLRAIGRVDGFSTGTSRGHLEGEPVLDEALTHEDRRRFQTGP